MLERWRIAGYLAFAGLLAAQAAFSAHHPRQWRAEFSPGPLPSLQALKLASAGESHMMATLLSLRLQTFDAQAGQTLTMRMLDGKRIGEWLDRIAGLAPAFRYPTFMASRIYAGTLPDEDARRLLQWLDGRFRENPQAHWAWQAFGVHLAKHRLGDLRLARALAFSLREKAPGTSIPQWARDLEFFLLTDLNELDAARALLGGLIDSGQLKDEKALRAMVETLEQAERRHDADARPTRPTP
ncbi:MAG: hypothetical protein R3E83_10005 [Burkholderiaceae bacterium]